MNGMLLLGLRVVSCVSAAGLGAVAGSGMAKRRASRERFLQSMKALGLGNAADRIRGGVFAGFTDPLGLWASLSCQLKCRAIRPSRLAYTLHGRAAKKWLTRYRAQLGRSDLCESALCECQFRLGLIGFLGGFILALAFNLPLLGAALLAAAGYAIASRVVLRAGREQIQARRSAMEQELPQMLAIVSLGLRSGLSFDQSLALYPKHFHTEFSRACNDALRQWQMSLSARDAALRQLAASYESSLLTQAVESMVRSLRFGVSLAENLDALAEEARARYRAACEEAIAKAPVKMLIPTCGLILPAMLLLIMGPVLLEMIGGI